MPDFGPQRIQGLLFVSHCIHIIFSFLFVDGGGISDVYLSL